MTLPSREASKEDDICTVRVSQQRTELFLGRRIHGRVMLAFGCFGEERGKIKIMGEKPPRQCSA
jgi:hypothetical protein